MHLTIYKKKRIDVWSVDRKETEGWSLFGRDVS